MRKVQRAYTETNQAMITQDMASKFNICLHFSYFIMNTAFSNDTLVKAVSQDWNNLGISYNAK